MWMLQSTCLNTWFHFKIGVGGTPYGLTSARKHVSRNSK